MAVEILRANLTKEQRAELLRTLKETIERSRRNKRLIVAKPERGP